MGGHSQNLRSKILIHKEVEQRQKIQSLMTLSVIKLTNGLGVEGRREFSLIFEIQINYTFTVSDTGIILISFSQ